MSLYLQLALLLILAKIFSDLSSRLKQPPVLGLLLLGIILGPSVTNFFQSNEIVKVLGEIGVFILLFLAGLETNLHKMKQEGILSFMIAICGVSVPFLTGLGLTLLFGQSLSRGLFLGTILTATSISVTVMTLWDLGKMDTVEGRTIISSAIIDDVMGMIVLTIISAFISSNHTHAATHAATYAATHAVTPIFSSLGLLVLFFLLVIPLGLWVIKPSINYSKSLKAHQAPVAIALGLMFIFGTLAEKCGLASITGAYMAGLIIGNTSSFALKKEIIGGFDVLGQSFFMAIFFINIGLEASLKSIHGDMLFVGLFIIGAILSKIIGCGLAAKAFKMPCRQSLRIGIGMVPRAEVALAVASIGLSLSVINRADFSMVVLMCLCTATITPILLHLTFRP